MKVIIKKSEIANRESFFRETGNLIGECAGSIAVVDSETIEYTFPPDLLPLFNEIFSHYC